MQCVGFGVIGAERTIRTAVSGRNVWEFLNGDQGNRDDRDGSRAADRWSPAWI